MTSSSSQKRSGNPRDFLVAENQDLKETRAHQEKLITILSGQLRWVLSTKKSVVSSDLFFGALAKEKALAKDRAVFLALNTQMPAVGTQRHDW